MVLGLRPLDDVELPVALHVGQGGRVGGDAVERVAPGQAAARVDGEDLVRVRGARVVAAVADGDADAAAGEELAHGRRRAVDVLVRVVLADQAAGRVPRPGVARAREDADVPAVGVGLPVGDAGARVAAADDLVVAVGVEVGHRRRREHRVGLEPREAAEHGPVAGAERVRCSGRAIRPRRRSRRRRRRPSATPRRAECGVGSVPGLVSWTNHWSPPWGRWPGSRPRWAGGVAAADVDRVERRWR